MPVILLRQIGGAGASRVPFEQPEDGHHPVDDRHGVAFAGILGLSLSAHLHALEAIEAALFDINGKALGLPVYELPSGR